MNKKLLTHCFHNTYSGATQLNMYPIQREEKIFCQETLTN